MKKFNYLFSIKINKNDKKMSCSIFDNNMQEQDLFDLDYSVYIETRGKSLYVRTKTGLQLTNVSHYQVVGQTPGSDQTQVSPETDDEELLFIRSRDEVSEFCKNVKHDKILQSICWYNEQRGNGVDPKTLKNSFSVEKYRIARYFMFPKDLHEHFKNFSMIESEVRYERAQANMTLMRFREQNQGGKWLIRHSSYNRHPDYSEEVTNFGARYFALSFINKKSLKIEHSLFEYKPGIGWINDAPNGRTCRYFFLDILEFLLAKFGLEFGGLVSKYIEA